MYTTPYKSNEHIDPNDVIKFNDRYELVPGKTPVRNYYGQIVGHSIRHRTMLEHPCWFSKKPEIKKMSVGECIQKNPRYMIWVYKNLKINWSVFAEEKLKDLVESENALFEWLAR